MSKKNKDEKNRWRTETIAFRLSPEERVELDKLRKYRDTGKVLTLVLGGRVVGQNRWVIESIGESVNFWSKTGQILSCDVSISLKEYRKQVVTL